MRVFGIGLGRTGTTSLHQALKILGFRSKHCPRFTLDPAGQLCVSKEDIRAHDALTDEPVALIYKELDRRYPGARFILTVRELSNWLASRENNNRAMQPWWAKNPAVAVLHATLFGCASFDRDRYTAAFEAHTASVLDYFRGREADLLLMDLCAGEGWEKLCPFLGLSVPDAPFPRWNVFGETDYATRLRQLRTGIPGSPPIDRFS